MKFSPLLIVPAAVLVIIALIVFMLPSKQQPALPEGSEASAQATTSVETDTSSGGAAAQPEPEAPKPSGYTMAEVSAHADATSCWTVINGSVYDLTAWITKHPGGKKAILGLCGKDGTQAFMGQHGGQEDPERELASFRIGALI